MNHQDPYNIIISNEELKGHKEHKDHKDHKDRRENKNTRKQNKSDKDEHDKNKIVKNEHDEKNKFVKNEHDVKNDNDIITEFKEVPVTMERKLPRNLSETLGNAGLPRATIAASKEVPNGSIGCPTNKTVLQQHVQFFDTDQDNIINPIDTWRGFRKLGFNLAYSAMSVAVIHFGFSYPSQESWIPFLGNPFFKLYVERIYKDKHGSDSETYDTEGRFVPEKFEEIFSKYDSENKGGLNFNDIVRLIRGNANAIDPFGWMSAVFEWGTLYILCAQDGIVSKEDARSCYDGTLFYKIADSEEKRQKGIGLSTALKSLKEE